MKIPSNQGEADFDEVEVETDTEDEETIEKETEQKVMKEFKVAQVAAKYAYEGEGLAMKKGEVCRHIWISTNVRTFLYELLYLNTACVMNIHVRR